MIDDIEDGTILYKSRYMKEDVTIKDNYGRSIKIEQGWRLIVTFSKDYATYEKKIRNEQIERAKKLIAIPPNLTKLILMIVADLLKVLLLTKTERY